MIADHIELFVHYGLYTEGTPVHAYLMFDITHLQGIMYKLCTYTYTAPVYLIELLELID
jgi:hypothetical protein